MPLNLSPQDRRLLIIGGLVFATSVLLAIVFRPTASDAHFATSYSTAPEGAKAAYLLLQESGYRVERWARPPADLNDARNTVLILTDPTEYPTQDDKSAIQRFLTGGGEIVLASNFGYLFVTAPSPISIPLAQKFRALSPSAQALNAPEIESDAIAAKSEPSLGIPLYGDNAGYAVLQYAHGAGSVIWLASSSVLSNAGLGDSGNLEFLLSTIGSKSRRVLWDEYFHGYRVAGSTAVSHPQLAWLFAQLALLAGAVLVTFSRRSLPRRAPRQDSRLSPLEYVRALAQLYEYAGAANVAVDIFYEHFRYTLTKRLGLRHSASSQELTLAVAVRWPVDSQDFRTLLDSCESARFFEDLTRKEALMLVQRLYQYSLDLKLFPETTQEG